MEKLRNKYIQAIKSADDEAALETVRLAALGKKGEVSLKMRELGQMSPEERQSVGPALNELKNEIMSAISAKKVALEDLILNPSIRVVRCNLACPRKVSRFYPPNLSSN